MSDKKFDRLLSEFETSTWTMAMIAHEPVSAPGVRSMGLAATASSQAPLRIAKTFRRSFPAYLLDKNLPKRAGFSQIHSSCVAAATAVGRARNGDFSRCGNRPSRPRQRAVAFLAWRMGHERGCGRHSRLSTSCGDQRSLPGLRAIRGSGSDVDGSL